MKKLLALAGLWMLAAGGLPAGADEAVTPGADTEAARQQRIQWWREGRFGLFIHWGLYAIPAGVWKDKVHDTGYSEWIMFAEKIPAKEYSKLAGRSTR